MTATEPALKQAVALTEDELGFFRYICEIYPLAESPLRYLEDSSTEPMDPERTYESLRSRQLLAGDSPRANPDLALRLSIVSECAARVSLTVQQSSTQSRRDFYLASGRALEYARSEGVHQLGAAMSEAELARELVKLFPAKATVATSPLELSAGDYLVFAVFARDVRSSPPLTGPDAPMSIDEVLAYFDEPETKYIRTPSDDSWQASVKTLFGKGVLVAKGDGYELHPSLHPLARELVADRQHTIARYDFLDDQWLTRELQLYPTTDSVFRIGTQPDGAAVVEELALADLERRITGVVATLPTILGTTAVPAPGPAATSAAAAPTSRGAPAAGAPVRR